MQTISSVFERELQKLIAERRNKLSQDLIGGLAVTNMEQYAGLVARISELDEVLSMFDDVNRNMSKV